MSESNFDLFVHGEGLTALRVQVEGRENLADALRRAGLEVRPDLLVFVGQPAVVLAQSDVDVDDVQEVHEPANPASTLVELGLDSGGHIHCHVCRHIALTAHYKHHEARRRFSPATTIAAATAWARHRFKLTDDDAEVLVLQVCESDRRPRQDEHLGEFAHAPDCRVCFDLVPDEKIQG